MSRLWSLVQAYLDSQGRMSAAALARKIGVVPQTLDKWKTSRPGPENLRDLAHAIDRDYLVVKAAADADEEQYNPAELMDVMRNLRISDTDREILLRHITEDPQG